MKVTTERAKEGTVIIMLDGSLDTSGTEAATEPFNSAVANYRNAIVDLGKVKFLGSVGIRLLIMGAKALLASGGKLVLLNPGSTPKRVLEISGTDKIIPIFNTLEEALAEI